MISRSLGPEAGAAIGKLILLQLEFSSRVHHKFVSFFYVGLMFTLANSIAVSLYIVGFCESLQDFLKENDWGQIIDGAENDIRVVGLGVLVVILIIAFIGMDWVTRAQMGLLVVLIASQVCFVVGTIMGPKSDEERAKGFVGYNSKYLDILICLLLSWFLLPYQGIVTWKFCDCRNGIRK